MDIDIIGWRFYVATVLFSLLVITSNGFKRHIIPFRNKPGAISMTFNAPPCKIKVVGVGGAGGNAVNGMIAFSEYLPTVEFWCMNTDVQAISRNAAPNNVVLGNDVTRGLGAGGSPEVGKRAATESKETILRALQGADLVFVTAGMGGGTGTGAAPIVAEIAQSTGALTVGVVTRPFKFEGSRRSRQADEGLQELAKRVDTLLVVSNDRLMQLVPEKMTMENAFLVADDILRQGVIGTSEIILKPGLINVDFADVRSVMKKSGQALIGIGRGVGRSRAQDAAYGAVASPLLEYPVKGATGVILNIVGGETLSLQEVDAAVRIVTESVSSDANIIFGAMVDKSMGSEVAITVIATGLGKQAGTLQKLDLENSSSGVETEGSSSSKKQGIISFINRNLNRNRRRSN